MRLNENYGPTNLWNHKLQTPKKFYIMNMW